MGMGHQRWWQTYPGLSSWRCQQRRRLRLPRQARNFHHGVRVWRFHQRKIGLWRLLEIYNIIIALLFIFFAFLLLYKHQTSYEKLSFIENFSNNLKNTTASEFVLYISSSTSFIQFLEWHPFSLSPACHSLISDLKKQFFFHPYGKNLHA